MYNLQLLKAEIKHLEMLRELSIATFTTTYAQYNTEENMQNYIASEFFSDKLAEGVNSPYSGFYFAMEGNTAIGYIKVNYAAAQTDINDPESLELERIYILKEHQGKKAGQFLLDAALNIALQAGLKYLWLGVWDKNSNARQFYAKNGFMPFGSHMFMLGNDEQKDILLKLPVK
ncbi:GNAT family N-acetyltransferase [Flavobacterium sp. NRK1]|uniref:GNAT family N-acetyltransferase n=1 Tax=Flavobacterium sp. NRK1 TaxID=2954929 RepID=UPI002091FAD3|nr:GNAT family N-acetyltransferase [Flavobacterium sp. NRK1]MCO6147374.1 GNAT family N-acetyltransferase [Flavobacterium sp. NRK1]